MPLYEKFEALLEEKNQRAVDVARATGIPASTFSDWKKGKSRPKYAKVKAIADYFNVPIEFFF